MAVDSLLASKIYGDVMAQGKTLTKGLDAPDQAKPGQSFGDMLDTMIQDASETGKKSENLTIASAAGKAEMIDVVTAITAAEVSLETVLTVRDKVIEAYQSIMRMPI